MLGHVLVDVLVEAVVEGRGGWKKTIYRVKYNDGGGVGHRLADIDLGLLLLFFISCSSLSHIHCLACILC